MFSSRPALILIAESQSVAFEVLFTTSWTSSVPRTTSGTGMQLEMAVEYRGSALLLGLGQSGP